MFIDEIRFTDSYIRVDLSANSVREELDSVTATLTVVGPVDATKDTIVTIDWADGVGAIQAATIPAGQTTTTFTHKYRDDDPTLTPQALVQILVTSTNTVAGGSAGLTVHNVAPTITGLTLDRYEIDEGDEITLAAVFADVGLKDSHWVTIDWGDGRSPTSFAIASDAAREFERSHTYRDDHPRSGTPQDTLTLKLTIEDDDTGKVERTLQLVVNNVAPEFDELRLEETEIDEGDTAVLIGSFTDPGIDDTFTIDVDWGDGIVRSYQLGDVGSFVGTVGSFRIEREIEDDDPTGTPSDQLRIKVTLRDDDTGSDERELDLKVNNVEPEFDRIELVDNPSTEGDEVLLKVGFSDKGKKDTFTIEVDWGDGGALERFALEAVGAFDAETGTGSFEIAHRYVDDEPPGEDDQYTVTIKLIDDDTGEAEDTREQQVDNADPEVDGLEFTEEIDEGGTVLLSFFIKDAGVEDEVEVQIDWGDGRPGAQITVPGSYRDGDLVMVSYTYLDDDPTATPSDRYTIKITLTDDDGGSTDTEAEVTVNNLDPTNLDLGGDRVVGLGSVETLTLSFDDEGTEDTHQITWTWTSPDGAGGSVTGDVLFLTADQIGVWTVTAKVEDDDTGSDETTISIVVPDGAIEIEAPAEIEENTPFDATFTLVVDEAPATSTQLTVRWGDGSVQTVAMAAGQTQITLSHTYLDDDPTGTPVDPKAISATSTAVNGLGRR